MRPQTTQCWRPELPLMGCCCSNSKIHPSIVNRRENQRLVKNSIYAPPNLAFTNVNNKSVKAFSFGNSGAEPKESPTRQQTSSSSSSGEEIEDYSENFIRYNKDIMRNYKKKRAHRVKSKVPKTKGFDFPIFPETHGQRSSLPLHHHSSEESDIARKSPVNIPTHRSSNSLASQRTNDHVSYRRIDSSISSRISLSSEDKLNNAVSSDEEQRILFLKNQRNMIIQRTVVPVERQDAETQYYEETYSSRRLHDTFMQRRDLWNEDISVREMQDYNRNVGKGSRTKRVTRRPKSRRHYREQRIVDAYLAQPKVLIVPIVRESRKPRPITPSSNINNNYSHLPRRRRIRRKPWLVPSRTSQRNIPMLRESGIGSSNIRFASGVKIRTFDENLSESESSLQDSPSENKGTSMSNVASGNKGVYHSSFTRRRPVSRRAGQRPWTHRRPETRENVASPSRQRQRRSPSRSPTAYRH